ncbi:hypothetical protein T440DRAFT_136650 [Plenodomus tracheiphilus IPT5]|uniref:Uncharacterized protein n=1 Tax=Plenodomus tracheiphilus IPT5 TaxID=1408161 RepID=A0A6A7B2A6_9PLEO|nr:hypothetical protein T440DRAFT_136650 [Plenodomus tracheiphilus IPT5]
MLHALHARLHAIYGPAAPAPWRAHCRPSHAPALRRLTACSPSLPSWLAPALQRVQGVVRWCADAPTLEKPTMRSGTIANRRAASC